MLPRITQIFTDCFLIRMIWKNLLFAGTGFGVYLTVDGGAEWIPLKNCLPTISIKAIAIQKRENVLVLATFGRGFLCAG